MRVSRAGVAVLAGALALSAPAAAVIVGGGGSKSQDCLVVFDVDVSVPPTNPREVRCVDGDSSCDTDGKVNGVCTLSLRVCANSTFSSACSVNGVAQINVAHSFDTASDPRFDPDFLALQQEIDTTFANFITPVTTPDACTDPVLFEVPIKGPLGDNHCRRQSKKLQLDSVSPPPQLIGDHDTLELICEPAPVNGCDPQTLYNSTFDRIERQVFHQNCAVSGCHDSQSQTGGLLLEPGAAYNNLVNHPPSNGAAAAAGWLRVDVPPTPGTIGDLDKSFLYHKIEGDLPDSSYGLRMPRNRPKLNHTLREIIRDWIEAGAPPDTPGNWVPGTY